MSYDLLIVKGFDEDDEPVGAILNKQVLSALEEHPDVGKNEHGLWEYRDESIGFAISLDDEASSSREVVIFFPYSCPHPEITYRLAAEFSIWLAEKLKAKAFDPQLGKYLSSEDVESGVDCCVKSFRMVEQHALHRARNGEHVITGSRRALLRSMYLRGTPKRREAGFKIWHIVFVVIFALLITRLGRMAFRAIFGSNAPKAAENVEQENMPGKEELLENGLNRYLRRIAINPNDVEAHFEAGMYLFALKRHEEATDYFETVCELDPDNEEAWELLCMCLTLLDRLDEAKKHAAQARALGHKLPRLPYPLFHHGKQRKHEE